MTTSGTAGWNPDLTEIVEEAFERCGVELRSGYDLRTARRSLNLLFADFANRGLNMFTFEQGSIPLLAGVGSYDLPADTVDLLEHTIRTGAGATQADISMSRISVSTFASIPNKLSQGRPLQIFIERLVAQPKANVWPVPDQTGVYTLVYWRLRRIQDAAGGSTTMDVPFRFIPALTAGLAYYLAMKVPGGIDRLQVLKTQYDEAWDYAAYEDRDKSADRYVPRQQYIS